MININVKNDLLNILPQGKLKEDEPLSKYTFTKTGGNADFLTFPTTYSEVQQIVKYTNDNKLPLTILGNGSNLIIKDGGIRGVVIVLTKMDTISLHGNKIVAQSGATIINTSRFALEHHLTGLEFACGIPGTVGGAVYMNAGAYEGEVKDVLESVLVLTEKGELKTLHNHELGLKYRGSIIPQEKLLVLEATFELLSGDTKEIKAKMDNLTYLRESKQPLEYPSCGSVFKRPPNLFAGKLIQDSGLQGKTIGGVQVSTKHAGFMVNINNGTATDYLNLIKYVQDTVNEKFGVMLETEVKVIGEDVQ